MYKVTEMYHAIKGSYNFIEFIGWSTSLKVFSIASSIFLMKRAWNWYTNFVEKNNLLIKDCAKLDEDFLRTVHDKLRNSQSNTIEVFIKKHLENYSKLLLDQNNILLDDIDRNLPKEINYDALSSTFIELLLPCMSQFELTVNQAFEEIRLTKYNETYFELAKSDRAYINSLTNFNDALYGRGHLSYTFTFAPVIKAYKDVCESLPDAPFYIHHETLGGIDSIGSSLSRIDLNRRQN